MRFSLVVIIIMFTSFSAHANGWGKAYVDKEDGEFLSAFSDPGVDWDTCRQNASCQNMGWLDRNSDVEIVSDPVVMPSLDYQTKEVRDKTYVQVKFSYNRINPNGQRAIKTNVYGWVEADSVKREKYATFFGSDAKPESCPPALIVTKSLADRKKQAETLKRATENKAVVADAEALAPYIGACVSQPAPASYKEGSVYDNYVLPYMNKQGVPNMKKEGGAKLTRQDLIDIDALARTMYSEMANCYASGLHFPYGVARTALNRAESKTRRDEFIHGIHGANKGDIAKAVTSSYKYSAWNRADEKGNRNPTVAKALCPSAPMNKVMWTGKAPTPQEKEIWKNTLRIATEAVLFPKQFKLRSPDFNQFFYTSVINRPGWKQVYPVVDGRTINKNSCMRVWQD